MKAPATPRTAVIERIRRHMGSDPAFWLKLVLLSLAWGPGLIVLARELEEQEPGDRDLRRVLEYIGICATTILVISYPLWRMDRTVGAIFLILYLAGALLSLLVCAFVPRLLWSLEEDEDAAEVS